MVSAVINFFRIKNTKTKPFWRLYSAIISEAKRKGKSDESSAGPAMT